MHVPSLLLLLSYYVNFPSWQPPSHMLTRLVAAALAPNFGPSPFFVFVFFLSLDPLGYSYAIHRIKLKIYFSTKQV